MESATASVGQPSASSTSVISLKGIRCYGYRDPGVFKMSGELFGWRNSKTGAVQQFSAKDLRKAEWIKIGPNIFQLKFYILDSKDRVILRLDGFQEKHYKELSTHLQKHFDVKLPRSKAACRGWHWGEYSIDDGDLSFVSDGKTLLDVSSKEIAQVTSSGTSEIAIEFVEMDKENFEDDVLTEVRFFMPVTGDVEEAEQRLEELRQTLLIGSGLAEGKMDNITLLTDVSLVVPRGRYEIDIGAKSFKLHGKSHDYSMQYTNINRMFLVPLPSSPHVALVIGLDKAMQQGKTHYPFLVMQFEVDVSISLDLNLPKEELEKLKLENPLEGEVSEVVTGLFKALVGRSITVPGEFSSANDMKGVTCTYKTNSGYFYPLSRSFLFITKPVIFIRYDDIVNVQFSRAGTHSQNRFFSFTVSVKAGSDYEFTNVDRNEYKPLFSFFQSKNIKAKNAQEVNASTNMNDIDNDLHSDDTDDDDFNEEEDDDEDEDDADDEGQSQDAGSDDE